jgi:RND family efflux transporter MFP subunit
VRAILDNKNDTLLPGQVVRARVEGVNLAGALVIPKRAVMHGAQGSFVWGIGQDNKVAPKPVRLGVSSGNDVAVTQGLAAGDRIVTDGILKVQPDAVVKVTAAQGEGAESTQPAREAAAWDAGKGPS